MKRPLLVTATAFLVLCCAIGTAGAQTAPCTPAFPSPLFIPVTGTLGDIVVDDACEYVYITNTSQNRVEVFSVLTGTLQTPIPVGSQPVGLDITPDGTRMYVANSGGNNISLVDVAQRVELRRINIPPRQFFNDTPYSIAIANNGLALFSTTFAGSGFGARMMQLNLATEEATQRTDFFINGTTTERTHLSASGDRTAIGVVAGDISSGPVFKYTAGTNVFSGEKDLNAFISSVSLDQTGARVLVTPGAYVLDSALNLNGTITLEQGWGGGAVDPGGVLGYRSVASRLDVLNLSTFLKTGEIPLGDSVNLANLASTVGHMDISADGRLLAVITDHGISVVRAGGGITSITPQNAPRSTSLNVMVTGQMTHFAAGQTTADFGPGIIVHGVTVTDATHASVHVTVTSEAAIGFRDVRLTTAGEVAIGLSAFQVLDGARLIRVSPNRGQPGQQSLPVELSATMAHFAQGQTTLNFGPGITVADLQVTNANHLTALITIAPSAPLGAHLVTATTGGEVLTLTNAFVVRRLPSESRRVMYGLGKRPPGGVDNPQTVSVIDTTANAITATIEVGRGCLCVGSERITVSPDGANAYVTNDGDNTVSIIDTFTNSVTGTISIHDPAAVAVSPDNSILYVLSGSTPTAVHVVDTSTRNILTSIPVGVVQAFGMALTPNGSRLYVSTWGSNSVKVIDTAANGVVATIPVGVLPLSVDASPDGTQIHVTNVTCNTSNGCNPSGMSIIDTATNAVRVTLPVGPFPYDSKILPGGRRAYVAHASSRGIVIVDTTTGTPTGSVTGNSFAYALAVATDTNRAFVSAGASVQIVDTASDAVIAEIPVTTAHGLILSMATAPGAMRTIALNGTLAFGTVPVGRSVSRVLTTTNTGNSPLTVTSLTLPTGFSTNFSGATIPPGGSQSIVVTFAPVHGGSYGGTALVGGNHDGATVGMTLSGYAVTDATRKGDFDRDAATDIAVFRPSNGTWYVLQSGTAFTGGAGYVWGAATDMPVPGDYDGDGTADVAVYRPVSGHWFILKSSSNYATSLTYQWGTAGDVPVPGDYDGDGISDLAIYRPSSGAWYILRSNTGFTGGLGYFWGEAADVPIPGDYDGDGTTDIAVYRPGSGHWFILRSSANFAVWNTFQWGTTGDIPVAGDYDGDNRMDLAVFRPSNGTWYLVLSASNFTVGAGYVWGTSTDVPVPGDYDRDGRIDIAVYRPETGHWFVLKSTSNYSVHVTYQWGTGGDIPIPRRQ